MSISLCPPIRRAFSDQHPVARARTPVFHIPHGRDDTDDDDRLDERPPPPPSARPSPLPRGASTPILLSNGKPLKSSLKSSSSSPAVQHLHLRARSEPSTSKNVHFPEKDYGLATVRLFSCKARPAALSSPTNGDETETEGEDAPPTRIPFPSFASPARYEVDSARSSPVPSKISPLANTFLESLSMSSPSFSSTSPSAKPLLTGSILVRNLAFEKHVAVRFTLDDWQTVSEVCARYVDSLPSLPSKFSSTPSASSSADLLSQRAQSWDRFTFTIRLEDYAPSLSTRTLSLATRYHVTSTYPSPNSVECGPGGEWWDNNDGHNYCVRFRPVVTARPRRETITGAVVLLSSALDAYSASTAPITSPRTQPPPTTFKEHALGLMIPSPSSNEAHPVNDSDRFSALPRAGRLNLRNYVPPAVRPTSTITFPTVASSGSSDEDSPSPTSSNLSTPSVSPTITPRVMIGGQPATYPGCSSEDDDCAAASRPAHVVDWDWSAPSKPEIERLTRRYADPAPVPDALPVLGERLSEGSLYDAFVTKWCFAQEPSLHHLGYDGGGIVA